jgi:tetratricopeptide (TPR) repeat protein
VKQCGLPDPARETLERAALLGVEFSVPVLLSAGASLAGLDRLFDDGWLAEAGPSRARFLQPAQVREVVAAIPWSRRRKWHSELARASKALRQPASDAAHHYLAAGDFEVARPMLIRAAEKARQQRGFRQALTLIRQALDIWPIDVESEARLCTLEEMARCAMNCRDVTIGRVAWEEILETASDAARLVEAHRQLAELDLGAGCFDDAGRHLETAAELGAKSLAA